MTQGLLKVERSRNAVFQTGYHMVWCPKYRRKILIGEVKSALISLLDEISTSYKFRILTVDVQPDHIHLFVSLPPAFSPAFAAKVFKGITARKLLHSLPSLRQTCHKGALWSPSYYVGTIGNASAVTVQRYIDEMQTDRRR